MTIQIVNRSYKGLSDLSIVRLNDGIVYNFPSALNLVVNDNVTEKIQTNRNSAGEKAFAGSYPTGKMPEMTVSYEYMQPEMISFKQNSLLVAGSIDTKLPRQVLASQEVIGADSATGIYFGLAEDAPTVASVTRNSISTPLTQQPYTTFSNTTDDSFAIGDNGEIKLSANLVSAREVCTFVMDVIGLTAVSMSDLIVGPCAVRCKLVNSLNQVDLFEAPEAYINLSSNTFDFSGEGNIEMAFRLSTPANSCRAYNIYSTSLTVSC